MILIDTCILSSLAKIERLNLLDILFKKHFCYITPSILRELNVNMVAGFNFVEKIEEMVSFAEARNKLCILSPESKNAILLTDDAYLAKVAVKGGIEKVYDLKSLLEACIIEGNIKNRSELEGIIESLRKKDYYTFSESNLMELFAHFQQDNNQEKQQDIKGA